MSDALPFTLDNLTGAAARTMLAPITAVLPTDAADIYDQSAPYAPVGAEWFNVGATSGPLQVSRNLAVAGYTIEQSQTVLLEAPTEVTYTVQVPFAEISAKTLKIINDSADSQVVAGSPGQNPGTKIPFGNIFDLTHYRIAFVVRRSKQQGVVTEPSGLKRGAYVTYVGYDCAITAENVQMNMGKGQLASASLTFKLSPDPAITEEGAEHGFFFIEDAGAIA